MKWFLCLFLFLGACASTDGMTLEQKRNETAAKIELGYTVLNLAVNTYCTPGLGTVCSTPEAQVEIQKARAVADVTVQVIIKNVLAATDYSSISGYLTTAMDALKVFAKVLATYGLATTTT